MVGGYVLPNAPPSEILPGVWLGDVDDALDFNGFVVSVYDHQLVYVGAHWVPIMVGDQINDPTTYRADRLMLDSAAMIIRSYQQRGMPVMVHCMAGIERSPMTMAWFLKKYGFAKTINDAYHHIKAIRPIVQERIHWLPNNDRKLLE